MIPATLLQNKNILLGITGSISAYKAIELIRLYTKAGAQVRVIMTEGAKRFITALTVEALSGNQILDEDTENWHSDHNHIGIGKWADIFVIAPCTANTLNKLSHGIADNLLTQTALAYSDEKILALAANTAMIDNPLTQTSIENVQKANFTLVAPQIKELACKTEGNGALAEPIEIFYATARAVLKEDFWSGREAIVTGGGSIEKIDDVRFISNFSSGKMASSLVLALYFKGAKVSFVSSAFPVTLPLSVKVFNTSSAKEMYEEVTKTLDKVRNTTCEPFLFMAAAVADYTPKDAKKGKLKKDKMSDTWEIKMTKNIDILHSIDKSGIKTIGFKAEMDKKEALNSATNMLSKKSLDAVCLNILEDETSFGTDNNAITIIDAKGSRDLGSKDKLSLSLDILQSVQSL